MSRIDELLECLRSKTGCVFLSDLHQAYQQGLLQGLGSVRTPEGTPYSLEDWTQALCYITGREEAFCSVEEAVGFLTRSPVPSGGAEDCHRGEIFI